MDANEAVRLCDYFWARALVSITGIVFVSQLMLEPFVVRKAGFENTVYWCGAAFTFALLYSMALILINAWRRTKAQAAKGRA